MNRYQSEATGPNVELRQSESRPDYMELKILDQKGRHIRIEIHKVDVLSLFSGFLAEFSQELWTFYPSEDQE